LGAFGGPFLGLCLDPLRAENQALPTQKGSGMATSENNQWIHLFTTS